MRTQASGFKDQNRENNPSYLHSYPSAFSSTTTYNVHPPTSWLAYRWFLTTFKPTLKTNDFPPTVNLACFWICRTVYFNYPSLWVKSFMITFVFIVLIVLKCFGEMKGNLMRWFVELLMFFIDLSKDKNLILISSKKCYNNLRIMINL